MMNRGRPRHGMTHDPTLVKPNIPLRTTLDEPTLGRPVPEQNNDNLLVARAVSVNDTIRGDMLDDPTQLKGMWVYFWLSRGLLDMRVPRAAVPCLVVLVLLVFSEHGGDLQSAFYADPTIYDYRGGDDETVDSWVDAVENGELEDERVIWFGTRVLKVLGIVHSAPPLVRRQDPVKDGRE